MTKKRSIGKSKRAKGTSRPQQVHEIKITLKGSKPAIWRRVAVASDIPLNELHKVIQIVMGWYNSHLHQFITREQYWSDPQFKLEDTENERKATLMELAPNVGDKLVYEYDFGDGWEHEIKVMKIEPADENVDYPVCLAGKLACPPEDCGGIWGYYDMLDTIADAKHPEHEDMLEWLGDDFDPEKFDIDSINVRLRNPDSHIMDTW